MKLPNKLSALMRLALDDLAAVEKSSRYVVDMDVWHTPNVVEKTCTVCFAGAVMARSLDTPINADVSLMPFTSSNAGKLAALNSIRKGEVREALWMFYGEGREFPWPYVDGPSYETDRRGWKLRMRKIIRLLEEAGL